MALIHMENIELHAKCAQQTDSTDSKNNFLSQAITFVSLVQSVAKLANLIRIFGNVRIQEV